jgi:hypothetical protein
MRKSASAFSSDISSAHFLGEDASVKQKKYIARFSGFLKLNR